MGQATTLDHYLPKGFYPQLSVVPANLVPSCKDCNTGKNNSIATCAHEQNLHPYFDHNNFISEQWLFAKVIKTVPVTIEFYVVAPIHWDDSSKARVSSHFKNFNLASRYAIEACNELSSLRDTLSKYCELLGPMHVKQHLKIGAASHLTQHKNSWQTALFQALSECEWYCNGGFN